MHRRINYLAQLQAVKLFADGSYACKKYTYISGPHDKRPFPHNMKYNDIIPPLTTDGTT